MNTLFTKMVPALVGAALLLPALSAAGVRPDDRAGIHGVGAPLATQVARFPRPDDRAGIRGIGRAQSPRLTQADRGEGAGQGVYPDWFGRYLQIHRADAARPSVSAGRVVWPYVAGISAAAAVALMMVAAHMLRGRRATAHA